MHRAVFVLFVLVPVAACGKEGSPDIVAFESPAIEATATPEATSEATPAAPSPTPTVAPTPEPTPVGWSRVDEDTFSFELPDDAKRQKVQPIDSQIGHFTSGTLFVDYDYGWYSADGSEEHEKSPDFRDQWTRIDGRFAHIAYWRRPAGTQQDEDDPSTRYEYQGGVYFPDVNKTSDSTPEPTEPAAQVTKLRLNVSSRDGWDVAERIIESIRFSDRR